MISFGVTTYDKECPSLSFCQDERISFSKYSFKCKDITVYTNKSIENGWLLMIYLHNDFCVQKMHLWTSELCLWMCSHHQGAVEILKSHRYKSAPASACSPVEFGAGQLLLFLPNMRQRLYDLMKHMKVISIYGLFVFFLCLSTSCIWGQSTSTNQVSRAFPLFRVKPVRFLS